MNLYKVRLKNRILGRFEYVRANGFVEPLFPAGTTYFKDKEGKNVAMFKTMDIERIVKIEEENNAE